MREKEPVRATKYCQIRVWLTVYFILFGKPIKLMSHQELQSTGQYQNTLQQYHIGGSDTNKFSFGISVGLKIEIIYI